MAARLTAVTGYKFESLGLIPDIWDSVSREFIESRESHIVDNIQQYCSIVQTGIGGTSLIIGGEVDAGRYNEPSLAMIAYVSS
jgi:RAT1-interacting protein